MNALLEFLSGKKTYLTVAAVGILLFGVWQSWWTIPNEVYLALMALALAFLRSGINKVPPTGGTGGPGKTADPDFKLPMFMAFALFVVTIYIGCSHLQPGADPLVVNVERVETVGKSTFDLVLHVDHTDRGFWATNAPAFHSFCDWLRQPITIEATNTLPRASALLLSLDDVKLDYKAARCSSNAVIEALATFQGILNQAIAWSTVVTNQAKLSP
jgi:hypothetical protein